MKLNEYSIDLVEQIIQEIKDTGNAALVARRHNIPKATVYYWARKLNVNIKASRKNKETDSTLMLENKRPKKELEKSKISIQIMGDLLKKTYQIWNGA